MFLKENYDKKPGFLERLLKSIGKNLFTSLCLKLILVSPLRRYFNKDMHLKLSNNLEKIASRCCNKGAAQIIS